MAHIKTLTVNHWKHISLDKPVELKSGVNLLLGKNGSGKTSLIGMVEAAAVNQHQPLSPEDQGMYGEGSQLARIEVQDDTAVTLIDNARRGTEGQWTPNTLQTLIRSIGSNRSVSSGTNAKNPFASSLNYDTNSLAPGQSIDVAEEFNNAIIKELIGVIMAKVGEGTDYLKEIQDDYQSGLIDFDKTLKIDPTKENAVSFIDHLGRDVHINNLSSGEKEYLYFYSYLRRIRSDSGKVILIDEPELHLHSSQIRKLCELISILAVNNQIVIATHSGEVLQHFISQANIILLSKGKVTVVEDAEQMRQMLEETGLPIDPSVFTAHWICAENDPTVALYGGGPTTPEVLGWIFGNSLDKRYWSFGSNRATSKIYGEGIAVSANATQNIRITPLLDGDRLIKVPSEYPPAAVPDPENGLTYFPFWEIENIFLSPGVLNAVIGEAEGVIGADRFWTLVEERQMSLLASVKKTIAKNSLRRFSVDKYIDATPEDDIQRWKDEIAATDVDLVPLDAAFASLVSGRVWQWIPGKEALSIILELEPNFWNKLRDLHQMKALKPLLEGEAVVSSFVAATVGLSGEVPVVQK